MASLDDVLAKAQPRTATAEVCLRGDLIAEHERHVDALQREQIEGADDEELLALAETIAAIEGEIRDATVEFVFANIGRARWTSLLAGHPPTEEQRRNFGQRIDHNPETFPYEAIAASCTSPEGVTPEKVRELEAVLSIGEWEALWKACLRVNVSGSRLGESAAASAIRRRLRPRSEQPSDSASGEASSSDES